MPFVNDMISVTAPCAANVACHDAARHMAKRPKRSKRQNLGLAIRAGSVPIPKFARFVGTLSCELRNQRDTTKYIILVRFLDLKFLWELPTGL